MRVMVLGVTGMLGSTMFRRFAKRDNIETIGTCRQVPDGLAETARSRIIEMVEADRFNSVERAICENQPNVVVNCIGVIKQLESANDPLVAIEMNALFPHKIAALCAREGIRLVHISTDCVFSGTKGVPYKETDAPDADDLYGRTKLLGEVTQGTAITIRTSIIGHELKQRLGLVEWFLSQTGTVQGYTNALFSGLPTCELSDIILLNILPNTRLKGLYQVSSATISKFELLSLIGKQYATSTTIKPDDSIIVNKSLDSHRFHLAAGYTPPSWPELVRRMHQDFLTIRNK
jgi:dTDP-4-dehydrorhamnose reductase